MQTHPVENGVANELQRIERDFQTQRHQLAEESSRFATWQSEWTTRQESIDASLAQLRARLQEPDRELMQTALRLFQRSEPPINDH